MVLLVLHIGVINAADTRVDIVGRLKEHSKWFCECLEVTNKSDVEIYDVIMETSGMNLKPMMHTK